MTRLIIAGKARAEYDKVKEEEKKAARERIDRGVVPKR
jgi:hypothetical protein